jgi:hypothetical protein
MVVYLVSISAITVNNTCHTPIRNNTFSYKPPDCYALTCIRLSFLVILSDYYDLPFNDVLDWRKFAVVLKERDVYQLKSILKSISQEEFVSLHKSLVQVYDPGYL